MFAPFGDPARQTGITMVGLIVLGALLAFWVLIIIKLSPVYMDARAVRAIFEQYQAEYKTVGTEKRKVEDFFSRYFQINAVYDVNPKDIVIEKMKKEVKVSLDYEIRVPFFTDTDYGDLFVLLVFSEEVTVPRQP
jgi:hypothetical protein